MSSKKYNFEELELEFCYMCKPCPVTLSMSVKGESECCSITAHARVCVPPEQTCTLHLASVFSVVSHRCQMSGHTSIFDISQTHCVRTHSSLTSAAIDSCPSLRLPSDSLTRPWLHTHLSADLCVRLHVAHSCTVVPLHQVHLELCASPAPIRYTAATTAAGCAACFT